MRYKYFKKLKTLPDTFSLNGEDIGSIVRFGFFKKNRDILVINTSSDNFSRQDVFNFAMILLKAANEMENYNEK